MNWRDIDITLNRQHDGDIKADEDIDAIINSIINIFKTFQGSRRMVPSFAMPVYNLLFEQIDETTLSQLEGVFLNAVEMWEDRIVIKDIKATADEDNNKINISLKFSIKSDLEDRVFNVNETLVM